jgi:hypothetical protein
MVLRLLKRTGPGVLFIILIIFSAVWAGAFLNPHSTAGLIYETQPMPLYELLKLALGSGSHYGLVFTVVQVAVVAFLIVTINSSGGLNDEKSLLPALIYILFGGFFPQYQVLNPVVTASAFLLIAMGRIMAAYNKPGIVYNFFDAAFLISTGSLFYANLIWFGLLVFIGIAILRTGNITELAISLAGLIAPYFIAFGILYVAGRDPFELWQLIVVNLFGKTDSYHFTIFSMVAVVIVSAGVLASMGNLFSIMNTKKIKSRKIFSLQVSAFLIAVVIFFVIPSASIEMIWLIIIPASYFISHYFIYTKKSLLPEIYFMVIILIIFFIQVSSLK